MEKEKREVTIHIRLSAAEAGMAKAQADRLGLTVSAYVRMLIRGKQKK